MEPKFESPTLLEIDHRAVIHNARRTIKSVESVLVELITNSDDAYKREGTHGGEVGVYLALGTGKEVNAISVWDAAGGIEDLEAALKYGSRHSSIGGATMPKRGYHGRGLKEAIIALGTGWIRTIHKGIPSEVQVNVERSQVLVRKAKPPIDTSKWRITGDGTEVLIRVDQHKKWPLKYEPEKFSEWLPRHFELRDIVNRREVTLLCDFYSRRGQSHIRNKPFPLRWKKPPLHYLGEFSLSEGMVLKLYESEEVLEVTPDEHYSIAGILITAGGVPVDLHIFDKSHPGSHYFYGELEVPSLLRRLRSDEADELRTDRGGLDWRREECTVIEREVRDFLKPHYERRATSPEKIEDRKTRERLKQLTKEINKIAEKLVSELEPVKDGNKPPQPPSKFEIRPKVAYELPGNKRAFTLYAPKEFLLPFMMHSQGSVFVRIRLTSNHPSWFKVLTPDVELRPSKKYENCYTANADISIDKNAQLGAEATVIAEMEDQRDSATIRVAEPRDRTPSPRGLFNEITGDSLHDPPQPVRNDSAQKKMIIYTRFPGIAEALGVNMDRADTERGATLLGDLITEGLCRRIIDTEIEKGRLNDSNPEIWKKYDDLRKLALPKVHAVVRDIYLKQK
jgi:hypothetical protein